MTTLLTRDLKIAVVVGNGFNLDYLSNTSSLASWNTQCPFTWDLQSSVFNSSLQHPQLRLLRKVLDHYRFVEDDFTLLERIASGRLDPVLVGKLQSSYDGSAPCSNDNLYRHLAYAARQRLAIAFSAYNSFICRSLASNWQWARWIHQHKEEIKMIVSFNYDTLLEMVLTMHRIRYFYVLGPGQSETTYTCYPLPTPEIIPIFKPHGSTNFRLDKINIGHAAMGITLENLDFPLKVVEKDSILDDFWSVPNIVLPGEYSQMVDFQYVWPGYRLFQQLGRELTHCVFMGLSYWECDRPELDRLMDTLRAETEFVIANPNPTDQLRKTSAETVLSCVVAKRRSGLPVIHVAAG